MSVKDQSIMNDEIKSMRIVGVEQTGIRLEYADREIGYFTPTIGILGY